MEIEPNYLTRIADKQFEMLGSKIRFNDIPEDGVVVVDKKKQYWYDAYKLTEEQEQEWMNWAYEELKKMQAEEDFMYLNTRYGMVRRYKREGELF